MFRAIFFLFSFLLTFTFSPDFSLGTKFFSLLLGQAMIVHLCRETGRLLCVILVENAPTHCKPLSEFLIKFLLAGFALITSCRKVYQYIPLLSRASFQTVICYSVHWYLNITFLRHIHLMACQTYAEFIDHSFLSFPLKSLNRILSTAGRRLLKPPPPTLASRLLNSDFLFDSK